MENTALIVGYRKARYAIDASAVQEIVWLPELSPIEEMPPYIRGMFSLRGGVVPVLDLGVRFGYGQEQLCVEDRVVVITEAGCRIGILVNQLHDVASIGDDAIEPIGNFQIPGGQTRYLRGALMHDDSVLMWLDTSALLNETAGLDISDDTPNGSDGHAATDQADEPGGDLLRLRARNLAQKISHTDSAARRTFVLIRIGGEVFGLDVSTVIEFVHLRRMTPVPCAPSHIAGNVNLRGDILTVIDIRGIIGVSTDVAASEIVVLGMMGTPCGLVVEAIDDVIDIHPSDIAPAPETGASEDTRICQEVATVGSLIASLIDAERLISALRSRKRQYPFNVSGDSP